MLRRRKKCDGTRVPCGNCTRLGLNCENQIRLVWEDDVRRVGMKRRGPASTVKTGLPKHARHRDDYSGPPDSPGNTQHEYADLGSSTMAQPSGTRLPRWTGAASVAAISRFLQMSAYPRSLDSTEVFLLDHYIQRFSREYPTCSGPSNPFLSVFIPMAMKCSMVLDSLLALSGAQRWQHRSASMDKKSLKLRHRALKEARALLLIEDKHSSDGETSQLHASNHAAMSKPQAPALLRGLTSTSEENLFFLLTTSILFLLYEKVSGEPTWTPHMDFISQFFERSLTSLAIDPKRSPEVSEAVRFLHDIFVYNDLVRSTSLKTKPLSNFYFAATTANGASCSPLETAFFPSGVNEQTDFRRRYYFPNLIARLSARDLSVTERDIAAWDGSMDWLPSFALDHSESNDTGHNTVFSQTSPWNDRTIIRELYRTAASMYRLQLLNSRTQNTAPIDSVDSKNVDQSLPQLASFAHSLMISLSADSRYETALLWPIGIAAKELTVDQPDARANVLLRLRALENRFQLRHFQKVQHVLLRHWARQDGSPSVDALCSDEDAILLG